MNEYLGRKNRTLKNILILIYDSWVHLFCDFFLLLLEVFFANVKGELDRLGERERERVPIWVCLLNTKGVTQKDGVCEQEWALCNSSIY